MPTISPTRKQHLCTLSVSRAPSGTADASITITTQDEDRMGDVLVPEGVDLRDYRKNPVVLFGHDASALPVGRTTSIDVQPGAGIRAEFKWLEGDVFADRVRNAFEQGVLNAASVGFQPQKWEPHGKDGFKFTSWTLLEWSLCPVPANPNAVRTLKSFGLDGPAPLARAAVMLSQLTEELKGGRVLSTSNDARVQEASELLREVLATADEDDEEPAGEGFPIKVDGRTVLLPPEALTATVRAVFNREFIRARGGVVLDDEPVIQMPESDVRELLTDVLRQSLTNSVSNIKGRR